MSDSSRELFEKFKKENGEHVSYVDFMLTHSVSSRTVGIPEGKNPDEFLNRGAGFGEEILDYLAVFGVRPFTGTTPDTGEEIFGLEVLPDSAAEVVLRHFPTDHAAGMIAVHTALQDWMNGQLEENWGYMFTVGDETEG